MSTTRDRIIEKTAELFRRQGYSGTGVKQIVTEARAPFGSLYHFFPGGKEELGAETVRISGMHFGQLFPALFGPDPDVTTGVRTFFTAAAERLEASQYEEGCPVATVALEVAGTSEPLREACAEVFEGWTELAVERFVRAGLDRATARDLSIGMLAALEGALVLARTARSGEPMRVAGELAAQRVERALTAQRVEPALAVQQIERAPDRGGLAEAKPPTAARVRPRLRARWPDRGGQRFPGPALP